MLARRRKPGRGFHYRCKTTAQGRVTQAEVRRTRPKPCCRLLPVEWNPADPLSPLRRASPSLPLPRESSSPRIRRYFTRGFHAVWKGLLRETRTISSLISRIRFPLIHLARFLNFLDPDFLVAERNETKRNHVRVGLEVKAWWGKGGGITKRVNRADRCTTAAVTTSSVRLC